MNMRIIPFFGLFLLFFAVSGYSQKPAGNEKTNPSYVQDMLYFYMLKSEKVQLPDSVVTLIKNHAALNGLGEALALKVGTYLKPVFNDDLTPAERIEVCNLEMRFDAWNQVIPKYFYTNTIKRLEQIH